jgi:hypothetical protein
MTNKLHRPSASTLISPDKWLRLAVLLDSGIIVAKVRLAKRIKKTLISLVPKIIRHRLFVRKQPKLPYEKPALSTTHDLSAHAARVYAKLQKAIDEGQTRAHHC